MHIEAHQKQVLHRTYSLLESFSTTFGKFAVDVVLRRFFKLMPFSLLFVDIKPLSTSLVEFVLPSALESLLVVT